jgi:hypothetical protein
MISVIGMPAPKKATKAPARTARKKTRRQEEGRDSQVSEANLEIRCQEEKRREEKTFMKQVDLPVLAMLTGLSTA